MTEPVETELVARLREFVVSDELGNSDFSVCDEAADEIERLQAELREACHERDGYHAERDMARERLEWSSDQPYDGIAARDETIARTERNRDMWKGQCERQAKELARVRKLGEAMAEDTAVLEAAAEAHCDFFGGAGWWVTGLIADTKPKAIDAMRTAIRTALAAWIAEAGR